MADDGPETKKSIEKPPFDTAQLRKELELFFGLIYAPNLDWASRTIGSFKWGVYVFYDYDREPIYVGQTKERVSGRVRRHLTNQRTDAVAMSVLDPFEVFEIEVYPLPQFQSVSAKNLEASAYLNALEYHVHQQVIVESRFHAILNEKDPPEPTVEITIPAPLRARVVSDEVFRLRSHSDVRIARRAQIVSRLAQTIAERKVKTGLRRTLVTQARRLRRLASERFEELGGAQSVEKAPEGKGEEGEND